MIGENPTRNDMKIKHSFFIQLTLKTNLRKNQATLYMYLSQMALQKVFQNYQIVFVCEKEGKIVPQNNVTYVTSAPTNNNSWLRHCYGVRTLGILHCLDMKVLCTI